MIFRTRHLACVLLLLSSLGAAQAPAYGQFAFYGHHMAALLYRNGTNSGSEYAPGSHIAIRIGESVTGALPIATRASYSTTWTMRPPSAQSAFVHAVTGLAPFSARPA